MSGSLGGGGGGKLVQSVSVQDGTMATGTTLLPANNTIPQNNEGTEFMTLAVTPTDAANILEIQVTAICCHDTANAEIGIALFQDTIADALACALSKDSASTGYPHTVNFTHRMVAGTVAATTFKVRIGCQGAGTITFNGISGVQYYGGTLASSIIIRELKP